MHSSLGDAARRDFGAICAPESAASPLALVPLFSRRLKIGLIVVDEEHEPTYKQEGNLKYHARDLVLRGGANTAR